MSSNDKKSFGFTVNGEWMIPYLLTILGYYFGN
jgi:hypothetical protein